MNSRWNENLIIFAMVLVSTRFDSWIKIRVFGPTRDRLQVKLVKKLWKAQVWCKTMKKCCYVRILTLFDLWLNLGLTRGIFGHFSWKSHFGCSGAWMGYATSFWMFSWTHREKIIFFDFSGSGTQIENGQNMVTTNSYFYSLVIL